MKPIELILPLLPDVRKNGSGWSAKCPAHDDQHASLSISEGEDGRALLHCHAGCATKDVCNAIGLEMSDLYPPATNPDGRRRIVATYDYRSADGGLLFQVVRFEPKAFRQRRPDGKGGWIWKLGRTPRVLYRLPELLAAGPDELVFVAEGEKDVDNLAALGLVATTGMGGAGKWRGGDYNDHLRGRHVVLLPDHDPPGETHALDVAGQLHGVAASIKVLRLPDLPPKGDVSDWLSNGGTREELLRLAAEAPLYEPAEPPEPVVKGDDEEADSPAGQRAPKQAELLLGLADGAELFHTPGNQEPYAVIAVAGHRETHRIRSTAFRRWLVGRYYGSEKTAPNAAAVQAARDVLAARAVFDGPAALVHVRCAESDGAYWLDLANDAWQAVRVTPGGWQVVDDPPVRFIRPRGLLPLPVPERGGSVGELRPFLNLTNDDDWALLTAWVVAVLRPRGPYPILVVNGEAGAAKSTTCRIIRAVVDPNAAPLRSEPRENRDLYVAACNAWIQCFDNMSAVRPALADDLCRLATGAGFATRELYSDGEETIFDAMRPLIVNGIDDLASRGDLADRAVLLTLPAIDESARRAEAELWAAFEVARPSILGALLTAVSCGMHRATDVRLPELPRMADFAAWAVAAEPALDLAPGAFMAAYTANIASRIEIVIEAAAVGAPIRGFARSYGRWVGTAHELLNELSTERHSDERTRRRRDWPKTPRALSGALRRLAPALRKAGITLSFDDREPGTGRRLIVIGEGGCATVTTVTPSQNQPGAAKSPDSGVTVGVTVGAACDGEGRTDRHARNGPGAVKNGILDGCDGCDGVSHPTPHAPEHDGRNPEGVRWES